MLRLILGLLAIALVMVWGKAFYGSMRAYDQGETYLRAHQYIEAVTFFDRSIRWYAPFNPYVRKSAERLWEIGLQAEREGDIRLALIATRTIRRAFYAATNVCTPGTDWISKCDARISELMRVEQGEEENLGGSIRPGKSEFPRQESRWPSSLWSIITEIGLVGWIGSVMGFIVFSCRGNRKLRLLTYPAFVWGGCALIFFALWLFGMTRA